MSYTSSDNAMELAYKKLQEYSEITFTNVAKFMLPSLWKGCRAAIQTAVSVDEEAIAKPWLAKQWIVFKDKDKLVLDENYIVVLDTKKSYRFYAEHGKNGVSFYSDIERVNELDWQRAFPLKALGV